MRWLVLFIGLPVAAGLSLVSAIANWRFGVRLGAEDGDALAYGLASVCSDGLKVVLPFAVAWAWKRRRIAEWLAAAALWGVITVYSFVSALSFAAVNRSEIADRKAAQSQAHVDLRAELTAKRAEHRGLPKSRPVAAVESELQGAEHDRWWSWSKQCTDLQTREARQLCEGHTRLKTELATAERAAALEAEITALKAKLDQLPARAAAKATDPQVELFRELSGLSEGRIKAALAVLVCVLIELGSGLGLFVVLSLHRALVAETEPLVGSARLVEVAPHALVPTDEDWAHARIERQTKAMIGAAELYADYRLWLEARGRVNAMTVTAFGRWMSEAGMERAKLGGRIVYQGVRLRETAKLPAA